MALTSPRRRQHANTASHELYQRRMRESRFAILFLLFSVSSFAIGSLSPFPKVFLYASVTLFLGHLLGDCPDGSLFPFVCLCYLFAVFWNLLMIFYSDDSLLHSPPSVSLFLFTLLWGAVGFFLFLVLKQIAGIFFPSYIPSSYSSWSSSSRKPTTTTARPVSRPPPTIITTSPTPRPLVRRPPPVSSFPSPPSPNPSSMRENIRQTIGFSDQRGGGGREGGRERERGMENLRRHYEEIVVKYGMEKAVEILEKEALEAATESFPSSSFSSSFQVFLTHQGGGFVLDESQPVLTVGSHRMCDIVVNSNRVSRIHAVIILRGTNIIILDVGCQNGMSLLDSSHTPVKKTCQGHREHMIFPANELKILNLSDYYADLNHCVVITSKKCRVCNEYPRNCRLIPCLHYSCCENCALKISRCPECGYSVDQHSPSFSLDSSSFFE